MRGLIRSAPVLSLFALAASISYADTVELGRTLVERLESGQDVEELQQAILARAKKEKPAVPEEARRRLARGRAAMKLAKSKEDYAEAVREFQEALAQAPWLAEAYFNLGIAQEKAELYAQALRSFKGYLRAAPGASDAAKVNEKIYELEYAAEKQGQPPQTQQRRSETAPAPDPNSLSGAWRNKETGNKYEIAVTGSEFVARCLKCNPALTYKGAVMDRSIEGVSISGATTRGHCTIPESTHQMSGTIAPDGQSITLLDKNPIWYGRENPGGLLVRAHCVRVWIDHWEPDVLTLVR